MDDIRHQIDAIADEHGLAVIGVADACPFEQAHRVLEKRIEEGLNGSLRFTFSDPDVPTDVRTCFS